MIHAKRLQKWPCRADQFFFVGAKNIKSRENSNNEGNIAQSKSEKKQIEIFLSKSHIGQFKNSKFTSTCFYLIYVSTIYMLGCLIDLLEND